MRASEFLKSLKNVKSKGVKGISGFGAVGLGIDAYFGIDEYRRSKAEGMSTIGSTARAVGDAVISEVVGPGKYLAVEAIANLPKVGVNAAMAIDKQARAMGSVNRNKPFGSIGFNDTQQAYTMRQAGINMARNSKYAREAAMLGNEASYFSK